MPVILRDKARSQPGLVYAAARICLLETSIRVRNRKQALGPGLSVQVEIKTGERRIIQYLLSPMMQALDEEGAVTGMTAVSASLRANGSARSAAR